MRIIRTVFKDFIKEAFSKRKNQKLNIKSLFYDKELCFNLSEYFKASIWISPSKIFQNFPKQRISQCGICSRASRSQNLLLRLKLFPWTATCWKAMMNRVLRRRRRCKGCPIKLGKASPRPLLWTACCPIRWSVWRLDLFLCRDLQTKYLEGFEEWE